MTDRLYYSNAYLPEFDANVLQLTDTPDGRRAAILDRTAFYPTSGGQPYDTGRLGDARVLEVVDADDGTVLHVVDRDVPLGAVQGRIDWDRRFDHMQQHTGQHVLSAAFEHVASARTESFHLSPASVTIDLARELTAGEVERAELEANRVVWDDRPVTVSFVDAADAAGLPLRKHSVREGTLRLIDVHDFDLSACGGTHVQRTGAIGIIVVRGWERFRGGLRVEFACGGRALASHRGLRDAVASSTRLLSVLPSELPGAIERLQAEQKDARRQLKDLQSRLAAHEGGALADAARTVGGVRLVATALEGWDAAGLKLIAAAVASRSGHAAVLLGTPAPMSIVVARAGDVRLDSGAALKALTARFGGKGGGRPELAQGGGLDGAASEILDAAEAFVASQA